MNKRMLLINYKKKKTLTQNPFYPFKLFASILNSFIILELFDQED